MTTIPIAQCCACGVEKALRNLVLVHQRAPRPGTGWGCLVCHLPNDGAIALVCDECVARDVPLVLVCDGDLMNPGRKPMHELSLEPYEHDMEMHRGELQGTLQ